jgi:hypothetical protein
MAYKYIDADGDVCVHFERGKWDSFWGYLCPRCGIAIGDVSSAHDHENTCNGMRETNAEGRRLMWKSR